MNEKVSIIIVHKDQPEFLNIYLQSIRACSKQNDYEIIVVDNDSKSDESMKYLELLSTQSYIKLIKEQNKTFTECLMSGYLNSEKDSEYLIFSHSDNVVLYKSWLDFLIEKVIDNSKIGCMFVGPPREHVNIISNKSFGPNYNFIFTPRAIFEKIGGFAFKECSNVGLMIGYQLQLQEIEMDCVMVNPGTLLHHYGLKSISKEDKNKDMQKLYSVILDKKKK